MNEELLEAKWLKYTANGFEWLTFTPFWVIQRKVFDFFPGLLRFSSRLTFQSIRSKCSSLTKKRKNLLFSKQQLAYNTVTTPVKTIPTSTGVKMKTAQNHWKPSKGGKHISQEPRLTLSKPFQVTTNKSGPSLVCPNPTNPCGVRMCQVFWTTFFLFRIMYNFCSFVFWVPISN